MGNKDLNKAKNSKQDEWYTQLADIENELRHYKTYFKGKTVLCNCDDPYESNFFKYFAMSFNVLGLKKLICTCYAESPISHSQLTLFERREADKKPYVIQITKVEDYNGDGAIDLRDVEHLLKTKSGGPENLKGNGDFRSEECIEYLKEADIVVTNPPFSLFREYVAQLMEYKKDFLIIGSMNALHYKEIFPLIRDNKVWLGASIHSGDREFRVPDSYPIKAAGWRIDENGIKYIRVKGVRWFTNIDYKARHEELILYKKYSPDEYPKYENFAAIDVGRVSDIPVDYKGMMGVPDNFIDQYNPDQFEILGLGSGNLAKEIGVQRNYRGRTDLAYIVNGIHKCPYSRIIIRRRQHGNKT